MRLRLTDDWRIESDSRCYILQKCHVSAKGVLTWENKTYHSTISEAATHVGELSLRDSSAQTLAEALAVLESLTQALTESLTPHFEVTVR